uniref:Proline and serine-rich protein 2-like n=1 Tax=Sinocyclocheilus rhinocerous TaxID=307959 RepID=A0A673N2A1_9TELE
MQCIMHHVINTLETPTLFSQLNPFDLEERECILFFEETIGSLEEDDERTGISAGNHRLAVERPLSYTTARHPSPVDHDIIDLVHPTPDASKQKDTLPVMPDASHSNLIIPPETHFEVKPKRDLDVSDGPQFGHQPPAGSVPTPVVIASKIAEHQGAGGTSASQLLQRRRSLESPPNPSTKHGPPTHAKPTRFPDKISMLLGSREHIPHSIAAEAVSVQERRAQMLSSLSGTAHPLDGGEPACVRNLPIRSISFRDPTPDKSRMEAKASHSEAPVKQLPAPAPKPRSAPLSPELRRKSLPKPSFRTQGITVQFSGRGATDEARRDALRKLGLLRNTP